MKRTLIFLILLISLSFIAGVQSFQEYYKIDLNYNKGEFSLNNLNIELSDTKLGNHFGIYLVKVINLKNQTLNSTFFNVPNKILYDNIDENGTINGGGLLELDEVNFTIYAPYYENANEILIYDENLTEKLRVDVRMYSKFSKDELKKETLTKDEQLTKEEKAEFEKEAEPFIEKLAKNWWILVAILLILIIILIRRFKK
ncbi:MAG: hypothetical protein Q8O84_04535 [Nanoarchaeota archaeon]|nr:hypothetical protein [Nanoarchaeota archaeon]